MGKILVTRKQLLYLIIGLILVLAAGAFLATRAEAAPKKSPKGEYFAALSALYTDQLGGGLGLGYQFKSTGVMLLGQVTYTYANGQSGTVPFQVGCQQFQVPYTTNKTGDTGLGFTVAIPLRKAKK